MIFRGYSLFIFVLLFVSLQGIAQNNVYYIIGDFDHGLYDGQKVYLSKHDIIKQYPPIVIDSAIVYFDNFVFQGEINDSLAIATLTVEDSEDDSMDVVLEPGIIQVKFSESPIALGTPKNEELTGFSRRQARMQAQNLRLIQRKLRERTTAKTLQNRIDQQQEMLRQEVYDFISNNISNPLGQYYFTKEASILTTSQLEELYASAPSSFQQNFLAKRIMEDNVWSLGNLRSGKTFTTIALNDTRGEAIPMDTLIQSNKVILVDFWASWCGPCLRSVPELVELHKKYNKSGFEIIGVSLDDSRDSWVNAFTRTKMTWPQFIDDAGNFKGSAATTYDIKSLPQTYLLDQNKQIIGVDLRGKKLEETIQKALFQ